MSSCRSMSGYGRGVSETEDLRVTVELRSVNHRFLDLSFKLPRGWMALEPKIAAELRERLGRGRVEVFVRREILGSSGTEAHFDLGLARSIQQGAAELTTELRLDGSIGVRELLAMPGVVTTRDQAIDVGSEAPVLFAALALALDALAEMRQAEGSRLAEDLSQRFAAVGSGVDGIAKEASSLSEQIFERIQRRLDELLGTVDLDQARLAQEAALLADKAGVDEEITRLRSHLAQAMGLLESAEPVGRRLEFLVQEMNRETNTIGSKSGSTLISGQVVELKSELEKIREQVANVE
ncbi:MAG: YicC/YloC family endoribonuclease [Myxococcota bacterium]|nr:YicC/YloC family endoribonuclease [Myxococcota bacterium]